MKSHSCHHFIPDFKRLLADVQPEQVSEDLYCRNYLSHTLQHVDYYLKIYAKVLDLVQEKSDVNREGIKLLDYGTGNGLLGLFAVYCGFQKVYCQDVDPVFLSAAKNLSTQLHIFPSDFICGDIHSFASHPNSLFADAIVGTDVIEHIYNLDAFFAEICKLNSRMITVFTTASNPENYFKRKKLRALQIRDETIGYAGNHIDSTQHNSYRSMRYEIIQKHFPDLQPSQADKLAGATRGLRKEDILLAVEKFIQTSEYPKPGDAFNTCHPINGSWTERVLPIKRYRDIYHAYHFHFELKQGFYNEFTPGLKRFVNGILNILVKLFGGKVSPFIVLIGYKK